MRLSTDSLQMLDFLKSQFGFSLVLMAVLIGVILTCVAYCILLERKISAWLQDRLGPNRAGPKGLLQEALDPKRPVIRVGPEVEGEELRGAAYVGASYGLTNRSLGAVGLLGPLRMDYEKAIRAVRAAAFELSRLVDDVYGGH